jgi:predicted ArsR family transcriptional regulator
MKTSRQRVLEYVESHRAVTATDIGQALGMTPANARHHLAILQEQGSIKVIGQRRKGGKGRPTQVFGPASQFAGNNLDRLSSALLAEAEQNLNPGAYQDYLKRVANRLIAPPALDGQRRGAHLSQRLYEAIQQLNKRRYYARWEAHAHAPRLILENCPYKAIIAEHPELCQIDALILEALLDERVVQAAKLATDDRGATACIFQIGNQRIEDKHP